jgi:type VI secretion system secreted protein Hcp
VAITAGAATGIAQLSDNFTSPAAPVPGHGVLTYLSMKGAHTGAFTGGVTQAGHKGAIAVLGLDVELTVPTSQSTGLPSGKAVCKGLNFRKPTDRATPLLFAAAATGETITSAIFNEYQTSPAGKQMLTLQIRLTNAFISSLHHVNATTTGAYDDATLVPSAVTLTWKPTNTTSQYNCHRAT